MRLLQILTRASRRFSTISLLPIMLLSTFLVAQFASSLTDQTQNYDNFPRRVNVDRYSSSDGWAKSAIFWFGKAELSLPGRNYADVRLFYTDTALEVRVTIIDYFLWYHTNPGPGDDLTLYDAVALYLDVNHDRASAPQLDDYQFLIGTRHWQNVTNYMRQARGNGSGWNTAWDGSWIGWGGMSWSTGGPNNNGGSIDFGWTGGFVIPWTTLGLSGPPPEGTLWGIGLQLYDRDDQPPAGAVPPEVWPETFNQNSPATWAELHFGYDQYQPQPAVTEGTTLLRASSPTDNSVEDAWMGGGGWCTGGHEGELETNHGDDSSLFVGTEVAETHFPCFNKSYLRFSLDEIPANKTIISATLTLHVWGNADPSLAQRSWVHLFSIRDPWEEMTIHWNNAPFAFENISATWVYPYSQPGNIQWPGDAYVWDATKAVAEAYAAGLPVNLAIYGSDAEQHSSKYMTSSETGDWNVTGRPALRVTWGSPVGTVQKRVSNLAPQTAETVTYELQIVSSGETLTLVDVLPAGVSAPFNLSPGLSFVNGELTWSDTPGVGERVTLTYAVTVMAEFGALRNEVTLYQGETVIATDTAVIIVNAEQTYLPLVRRP